MKKKEASREVIEMVHIPSDATHEQRLALGGLINAFGWHYEELKAVPEINPIQEKILEENHLMQISSELWGAPEYGSTAYKHAPKLGNAQIGMWSKGEHVFIRTSEGEERRHMQLGTIAHGLPVLQALFDAHTKSLITHGYAIGMKPLTHRSDNGPWIDGVSLAKPVDALQLTLVPRKPTVASLTKCLNAHGLTHHTLSGSTGKILDVLNTVAGTSEPQTREHKGPMISLKDLEEMAKDARLLERDFTSIIIKLRDGVEKQLWIGAPDKDHIVVDGDINIFSIDNERGEMREGTYNSLHVAQSSLNMLAKSFKQGAEYYKNDTDDLRMKIFQEKVRVSNFLSQNFGI